MMSVAFTESVVEAVNRGQRAHVSHEELLCRRVLIAFPSWRWPAWRCSPTWRRRRFRVRHKIIDRPGDRGVAVEAGQRAGKGHDIAHSTVFGGFDAGRDPDLADFTRR